MTVKHCTLSIRGFYCLLVIVFIDPSVACATDKKTSLIVFAAASLIEPLTALGENYTQQTGVIINFSFAASSTLARQILSGANPDIYISANQQWMESLDAQDALTAGTRRAFLSNTLVLATGEESPLATFSFNAKTDLAALLQPGERIAVGDPDHVPVGMYTKRSLTQLGLWTTIEPLLARTDNTRATVALLERGEAPLGFVYLSDTNVSSSIKILATLPANPVDPIAYEWAIIKNSSDRAPEFIAFLEQDDARSVFSHYQFIPIDN